MPNPRYPLVMLATCCIPWREDFSFDEETFRRSVRALRETLTTDLYIFGTAGEGHAVTDAQFAPICRAFAAEAMTPGARPMVGVISLSLGTMIERIALAREMGFRRFQISLPSWGALSDSELRVFFAEVCGRFADCEFLHYNLQRTKRYVTAAEYSELAKRHPNLVATKHGTDSLPVLEALLRDAPELTHFITERGYAKASLLGPCGFLVSVSSLNPALAKEFFAAGQARNEQTLASFIAEFGNVLEVLFRHAKDVAHMDGAFDKIFCRAHDAGFPLRLLPPYASFDEATYRRIAAEIRERAPRWAPRA
jgi:dihydrodipicolinate synthase/N-acetylneuraminate lyase